MIDWDKVRTYVVPKELKDSKVCLRAVVIGADWADALLAAYAIRDEGDQADEGTFREGS